MALVLADGVVLLVSVSLSGVAARTVLSTVSVVYGLLALQSGIPNSELVFDLVAVTIALSIVLHSSTDVPVARMQTEQPDNLPPVCRIPNCHRRDPQSTTENA